MKDLLNIMGVQLKIVNLNAVAAIPQDILHERVFNYWLQNKHLTFCNMTEKSHIKGEFVSLSLTE